jgi:hypothetical protein
LRKELGQAQKTFERIIRFDKAKMPKKTSILNMIIVLYIASVVIMTTSTWLKGF